MKFASHTFNRQLPFQNSATHSCSSQGKLPLKIVCFMAIPLEKRRLFEEQKVLTENLCCCILYEERLYNSTCFTTTTIHMKDSWIWCIFLHFTNRQGNLVFLVFWVLDPEKPKRHHLTKLYRHRPQIAFPKKTKTPWFFSYLKSPTLPF